MEKTTLQTANPPVTQARSPAKPALESSFKRLEGAERTNFFVRNALGFAFSDQTNALGLTPLINQGLEWISGKNLLVAAAETVANNTPAQTTSQTVQVIVEKTTEEVVNHAAQVVTEKATEEVVNHAAQVVTEKATEEVVNQAAQVVTEKATEEVVNQAAQVVTEKATEEVVNQAAQVVTEKATEEVVNEAAQEAAKTASTAGSWFTCACDSTTGFCSNVANGIWNAKYRIGVAVVWGLAHSKTVEFAAKRFPDVSERMRTAGSFVFTGVVIWTALNGAWYATGYGGMDAAEMAAMGTSTLVMNKAWNVVGKLYHKFATYQQLPRIWNSLPSWRLSYPVLSNEDVRKKLF